VALRSLESFYMCTPELGARYRDNFRRILVEIISDFTEDSRDVKPGTLFFATHGQSFDCHDYVQDALSRGAVAAVVLDAFDNKSISESKLIRCENPNRLLALWSRYWFDYPDKELIVLGVTGTNGKTSVCLLTEAIINQISDARWASLGTLGLQSCQKKIQVPEELITGNTTPDAKRFFGMLRYLVDQNMRGVICEVSSHGIALDRVTGCDFQSIGFTNLSHDHLDFHKNFDDYFQTKAGFLKKTQKHIWIYADTQWGKKLSEMYPQAQTIGENGRVRFVSQSSIPQGIVLTYEIDDKKVQVEVSQSLSLFPENIGLALGLACDWTALPSYIDLTPLSISGRSECYVGKQGQYVVIDYAHTPDALESVMRRLKKNSPNQKLWVVFGCGGDRDPSKRSLMGEVACQFANHVVITSDNPRSESPQKIMTDIAKGISSKNLARVLVEVDRAKAIEYALQESRESDIVLIAGKGHEHVQIIGNKKTPFSDLTICQPYLAATQSLTLSTP
jgi:UDP-N-acetylmuramoyl-L-alanyl-D-glutamate--2,6-diaminopimelate ligase